MIEMFRAIGFHVPDEATYNQLAETAEALGDETRIDRRGITLHGRCWRVGEGLEIWTVLRESAEGIAAYVDCRPAFRPRYVHALGPWELVEYDEEGEAVVEGRIGKASSAVSFELQNLTELKTETFTRTRLSVAMAGLAYDVRPAVDESPAGLYGSDREGAAAPPDGSDYVVIGRVERTTPIANPLTGAGLVWLHLNAGDVRLEVLSCADAVGENAKVGMMLEAEVWLQGYVLTDDAVNARYEGWDPEWGMSDAWDICAGGTNRVKARTLVLLSLALLCLAVGGYVSYRHYWIHRYDELIDAVAGKYKLDPLLVHAVVYEESFFRPWASSHAGALGLMQVTGVVVDEWISERGYERMGSEARARFRDAREAAESDPEINLHIGCWYLSKMLARFSAEGDPMVVALAAYNAGATNAERWLKTSKKSGGKSFVDSIDFPETRSYVVGVRERYRKTVASRQ